MTVSMNDTPADRILAIIATGNVFEFYHEDKREVLAFHRGMNAALGQMKRSQKYAAYHPYLVRFRIMLRGHTVYCGDGDSMPQSGMKVREITAKED